MYGFQVHDGIDGASHYLLWGKVVLDKTKETMFYG
jgi:hypothetical protein